MSFSNILDRLKTAAYERQRGVNPHYATVRKADLTQILNMFESEDRLSHRLAAERDTAWQELREIREAIGANPEESTADEVRRVVAERDKALSQKDELVQFTIDDVFHNLFFAPSSPIPASKVREVEQWYRHKFQSSARYGEA